MNPDQHSPPSSIFDPVPLNNINHIVDVILINDDKRFPIHPGLISEILFEDDLYSVFPKVFLVFNNTGNVVDQYVKSPEVRDLVQGDTYQFNTDSQDIIYIKIKPVGRGPGNFPDRTYTIEGLFCIVDEDEMVMEGDSHSKYKKFTLRDVREDILDRRRLSWSTADVVASMFDNKVNLKQSGNTARKAPTGIAIKHLLHQALPTGTFFTSQWDDGKNRVFYSSGNNCSAFDDLEYLLDRHISSNDDRCILRSRNYDIDLVPIGDLFGKASARGEGRIGEIFNFPTLGPMDDSDDEDYAIIPGYSVPQGVMERTNTSNNFSILNISNRQSNREMVTPIVHNWTDGQFSIDCENTNILNVKDVMQNRYINKLPKVNDKHQKVIVPISSEKIDNRAVNHFYSSGHTQAERLNAGINRVINKVFALSPVMTVESQGNTSRRPGRFALAGMIGIDKKSPLAKLLLGEWMFTKVAHLFALNRKTYINTIVCNKAHTYEEVVDSDVIEEYNNYYQQLKDA